MAVADSDKVVSEVHRTLKRGGTALATNWETLRWLPVAHAAQKSVKPERPLFHDVMLPEW